MASACSRESLASRLALHLRHKPPIIAFFARARRWLFRSCRGRAHV